jgi:hypothetical protein
VLTVSTAAALVFYFLFALSPTATFGWPVTISTTLIGTLPIALLTGSSIRPGHALLFGAKPYGVRRIGLSVAAGLVLRFISILVLIEMLLVLVIWIGERLSLDSHGRLDEPLPVLILLIAYFAGSSYFSIKTPRKNSLVQTGVLLHLLLFPLLLYVQSLNPLEAQAVIPMLLSSFVPKFVIGLWAVYILGRYIAVEPASSEDNEKLPPNVELQVTS